MKSETENEIRTHAVRDYPNESCGVVVIINGKERYWPCRNIADKPTRDFVINPEDWANAEDLGEIVAVVHSHPDTLPKPTESDLVQCEASQLEWHIVHVAKEDGSKNIVADEIYTFGPTGYVAPLVGRTFSHGTLDCYSLVRDYYARELNIELPDFERHDEWWNNGGNLYMDNFAPAGFTPIRGLPQVGDIILMQLRSPVANHAAVYIGDGLILHHVANRLSSRDVYDGYWQEITRMIVRRQ